LELFLPSLSLDLPVPHSQFKSIPFTYLSRSDEMMGSPYHALSYLRKSRMTALGGYSSGVLGDYSMRWAYLSNLPAYCHELVREIGSNAYDTIISPPSRFPFTNAYRNAIRPSLSQSVDLSGRIERISESFAGRGADFDQHRKAFRFHPTLEIRSSKSLLIIDDIFWRGVTAAATLFHLRQAGLPHNAKVALACPLWIV
jgi:hypothetical protein